MKLGRFLKSVFKAIFCCYIEQKVKREIERLEIQKNSIKISYISSEDARTQQERFLIIGKFRIKK